jgi:two-component sensor histidine kinase
VLEVSDNGVGLAAGTLDESRSFGFQLVKSLAKQLGYGLRWDEVGGTKVSLVEGVGGQ